jgi:hypothetical protein
VFRVAFSFDHRKRARKDRRQPPISLALVDNF